MIKKNPFIWFEAKITKRFYIVNVLLFLMIVFLSFYIKNNLIFLLSSIFALIQFEVRTFVSYFLTIENESMFAFLPITARDFLKKLSFVAFLKFYIILLPGMIINVLFHSKDVLFCCLNFAFLSIFFYSLCLFTLSLISINNGKYVNTIIYVFISLSFLLTSFIKNKIYDDDFLAIIIVNFVLFVSSFLLLKKVNFEKMISDNKNIFGGLKHESFVIQKIN